MQVTYIEDTLGVWRVPAFEQFPWLEHGFGTGVSRSWPEATRLAMLRQVHSARVIVADGQTGYIGEGDALVTSMPGTFVGVRTAD